MIKTTNLNKYYLKGKENEIHVINDCNLELPDTGLVTILGESGSGKTTLLNVIGGLDKAKGMIDYDGKTFNGYKMGAIDKYRRENFGYIFQNYNILQDISIIDNLKIALELVGIIDKEEQDKRIKIALNAVGLYKFRKKPAGKLSGGQQQRVAIARALVKKCKVLIADEPTGNLDSTNSIEIMNILKKISETTLVLLVTHDKDLAEFYSSKIIELTDGKIVNIREANNNISLQNKDENKIYLKDLNEYKVDDEKIKMVSFSSHELPNINITLVEKNGTFYIKSNVKIKSLDESNLVLINDNYHEMDSNNYDEHLNYDTSSFDDTKKSKNLGRIFSVIKDGLVNYFKARKRVKLFRFIFILLGIILGYMAVLVTQYIKRDYSSVLNDKNVYIVENDSTKLDNLNNKLFEAYNNGLINSLNILNGYNINDNKDSIKFNYYKNSYVTESYSQNLYVLSYDTVAKKGIAKGRIPSNSKEIVIGKKLANKMLKKMKFKSYEEIFDSIVLDDSNVKIVGVSNSNTRTIYTYKDTRVDSLSIYSNSDYYDSIKKFYVPKYNSTYNTVMYYNTVNCNNYYGRYLVSTDKDSIYLVVNKKIIDSSKTLEYSLSYILNNVHFGRNYGFANYEDDKITYTVNDKTYNVVGIGTLDNYDEKYGGIVTNEIDFYRNFYNEPVSLYLDVKDYQMLSSDYVLVDGRMPKNRYECIVPLQYGLNVGDKINDGNYNYGEFTVTGVYLAKGYKHESINSYNYIFSTSIESEFYLANESMNSRYYLTTNNIDSLKKLIDDDIIKIYNVRKSLINDIDEHAKKDNITTLIVIAVLFSVVLIYIYFTMRSKMIHDIYEIGVLRNIGASRSRIYAKYVVEIMIMTLFTTIIGYLGFIFIYGYITSKINSLATLFGSYNIIETPYPYIGILLIFILNLIVGLIPILLLLRKTPKEISSKYDI